MRLIDLRRIWRDWLQASFANRVTALALTLTLGVSLTIGVGSYAALRAQIEAALRQDLEAQTRLVEEHLRFALGEAGESLQILSRNSFIVTGLVDSQGREAYLLPFLRDFRLGGLSQQDLALTLVDFAGKPIVKAAADSAIAPDLLGRAIASGKAQAQVVTHQGETYLRLVQPILFPPTRSVEGALSARIRLAPLLAAAGSTLPAGHHPHLLAGGRLVAESGSVDAHFVHVERRLELGAPFDALGLQLTLGTAQHAQAPLNRLTWIYLISTLMLLPLVGWLARSGARHLVVPLARLGATAEDIAAGGAIALPPQAEAPDEVGRLADAFGRMLERLRDAQADLERRVRERTHALDESRAFLAGLIEHSGSLIFVKDREGRYELVNRKWETVTGLDRDKILGRKDVELFPPPIGETFRANDLRVMATGQAEEIEEMLDDATGRRHFLSVKFPLRAADGEVRGLCGMANEVSERKQAEEALRESETRLSMALEATQIGIWDWDIKRDLWYASPTYFTMLGYEAEAGPCDRAVWLGRIHADDRQKVADKIGDVLRGSDAPYQYEARMCCADGSWRWIAVLGKAVERDEYGNVSRMRGVRMDITERKQSEQSISAQLDELLRWQQLTIGREERMLQLKAEVNELLARNGEPARYSNQAE